MTIVQTVATNLWARRMSAVGALVFALLVAAGCDDRRIVIADIDPALLDSSGTDSEEGHSGSGSTEREQASDSSAPSGVDCGDRKLWLGEKYVDDERDIEELSGVTHLEGNLTLRRFDTRSVSLAGLQSLRCLDGQLKIEYVGGLNDLGALSGLRRIGDGIILAFNDDLRNIDALKQLTEFYGMVRIKDNPRLSNCDCEGLRAHFLEMGWRGDWCHFHNGFETTCPNNCPQYFSAPPAMD